MDELYDSELERLLEEYERCWRDFQTAGDRLEAAVAEEKRARYAKEEATLKVRGHVEMKLATIRLRVKGEE